MTTHTPMTPMKASGIQHQVARVYREGGPYQWVRETLTNAMEAEATRVEFGVEWQAVESQGVYRRMIADDGVGMTPEQLVRFFNTWGGGGKPIGGVHENFGIGAKSSLLPWNRYGLVVVSWVDDEPSMIWVMADAHTGEYGLRNFEAVDETGEVKIVDVVAPFEDEHHGCDWAQVKPDWITDHGTVVVLVGDEPTQHTMLGDPNRPIESSLTGISGYLNRRYWEVPEDTHVTVEELRHNESAEWPKTRKEASGHAGRRTHRRKIEGAKHFIEYPVPQFKKGQLAAHGTVEIGHGASVEWFLWDGDRPQVQGYAAQGGYIAALYHGELYDVTAHHSTYRSFGILEAQVRGRLWLILNPPAVDSGHRFGVYPRGDRNSLLLKTPDSVGEALPINDWGSRFAEHMPEPIREAIRAARAGGTGSITDDTWRTRLIERFGSRWRIFRLRSSQEGEFTLDPAQPGSKPREMAPVAGATVTASDEGEETKAPERITGTAGQTNTGTAPGPKVASRHRVGGGIPTWTSVRADDIGDGMLAAWAPNHPDYPEGAVLINIEHPVLEEEIAHWQEQYPDHLADEIAQEVIASYGEVAVAKIAHSEHLKSLLPSSTVEEDLRSEAALTMSLLGLIGEEAVIAPRVSGKFGRRKAEKPEAVAA